MKNIFFNIYTHLTSIILNQINNIFTYNKNQDIRFKVFENYIQGHTQHKKRARTKPK